MVRPNLAILDQIAKFFFLLSDAPSYWFSINTCFDHAFHLSKRLGMDESDYKALLIAGNLARYKGGDFIIQANEWKSFLRGHRFFMDLPSNRHAFQFDKKRIALDGKRRDFYVIRIGREGDLSPLKFESQLKMDRLPPPNQFYQNPATIFLSGHRDGYCGGAR